MHTESAPPRETGDPSARERLLPRAWLPGLAWLLLHAVTAHAGPLGSTIAVPQDEPDLQTAVNQVQGLLGATVIIDDTVDYTGPILITDSVALVPAAGASPTFLAANAAPAIVVDVPVVIGRPQVQVTLEGLDIYSTSQPPGAQPSLVRVVHDTDLSGLTLVLQDIYLDGRDAAGRECLGVTAADNAAPVEISVHGGYCLAYAHAGQTIYGMRFSAPSGQVVIDQSSRFDISGERTASIPASTIGAIAMNNRGSGSTLALHLDNSSLFIHGSALFMQGILASFPGTQAYLERVDFRLQALSLVSDPDLQMESYAVHANDGGLIEARRSRFRDDSAGNADIRMQLRTTDAAGDGQSSLLAYNNLIETGSITLAAANSGGPPTAVRADLVNNTVLARAGDPAIGIVTQPAAIGQVSLLAYNNFLRGNGGIIHFIGPANGVVGDWDANGYDVDVATANSLTPGAGPDAVISATAFMDPAEGDYRHAFGSPMIDAGDDNAPDVPVTDFEGRPRPLGPATDIGAFESPDWIMLDGFETTPI